MLNADCGRGCWFYLGRARGFDRGMMPIDSDWLRLLGRRSYFSRSGHDGWLNCYVLWSDSVRLQIFDTSRR